MKTLLPVMAEPISTPRTLHAVGNWTFALHVDDRGIPRATVVDAHGNTRVWRGGVEVTFLRFGKPAVWGLPSGTMVESAELRFELEVAYNRHLDMVS